MYATGTVFHSVISESNVTFCIVYWYHLVGKFNVFRRAGPSPVVDFFATTPAISEGRDHFNSNELRCNFNKITHSAGSK